MAYLWRELTREQRAGLLAWRKQQEFPWHSPPHALRAQGTYHLTAGIHAWCVLPNHYHLLITTPDLRSAIWALGRLHGRTSFRWNKEEGARGRQVWCAAADRFMRGDRHFWATMNYIHHNPVRHGYVKQWPDWPYSSAHEFLAGIGRGEAERLWREYPLEDYGRDWDEPWM